MRILFLLLIAAGIATAQDLPEGATKFTPEETPEQNTIPQPELNVSEDDSKLPSLDLPEIPDVQTQEEMPEETVPVNPRVQFLLDAGLQYAEEGEHEEAERAYLRALEEDPDNPDIRMRLSTLYILMERYSDALDLLKKLEKEFPDNPMVQNNMAWIYSTGGKMRNGKLALRHARNAILIYPLAASMWNTLAEAYYVIGDYEKALRSADHALDLLQQQNGSEEQIEQFLFQRNKIQRAKSAFDRLFGADEEDS